MFFDLTTIKKYCGGKGIRVHQYKSVANLGGEVCGFRNTK